MSTFSQDYGKSEVVRLINRFGDDDNFASLFQNKSKEAQIALAAEHGFHFTDEDLNTVLKSVTKQPSTGALLFADCAFTNPVEACCTNSAKATRVLGCFL